LRRHWFEPNGEGTAQAPPLADNLVRSRNHVGSGTDRQARRQPAYGDAAIQT
jgi:hypothetical protein